MPTYRNTKSGVLVTVKSEVKGDWVLVPDSPEPVIKVQTEKKRKTRAKKTAEK